MAVSFCAVRGIAEPAALVMKRSKAVKNHKNFMMMTGGFISVWHVELNEEDNILGQV